jgi:probable F420-dependent oxidoreductase
VAYTAWDLAAASGGRFILGLGSQVRAHIERRFGMDWPAAPLSKMREFVGALRALWRSWQHGEPLNFKGEYFRLGLMTPFFNPGPIEHPEIPIFLAGVNQGSLRLAGEVADGLHAHPLHSVRYLREVVRPALAEGSRKADRDPAQLQLSVTAFVASDEAEAAEVKRQIAFYASTPNYRPVLALHGWGEVADRLSQLVRQGQWDSMAAQISDDMLDAFAVGGQGEELGSALRQRYQGLADRINLYRPLQLGAERNWQPILKGLRA